MIISQSSFLAKTLNRRGGWFGKGKGKVDEVRKVVVPLESRRHNAFNLWKWNPSNCNSGFRI